MEHAGYQDQFHAEIVALLPSLNAFSRRLHGNRPDVDDLVQETVLKALAHSEQFIPGSNLKSWLFTIMKNLFCTRFHASKREITGDENVMDARITLPEQDWLLMCQDVDHSIKQLPPHFRSVLLSITLDGKHYDEVAHDLHCAVGTVKSRLNRARHALHQQFSTVSV